MVINLNYYLSDSEIGCPADLQPTQQSRIMLQKLPGLGILVDQLVRLQISISSWGVIV
jgi:hypothetical protein